MTTDFAGASGTSFGQKTASNNDTITVTDPTALAAYTGTGTVQARGILDNPNRLLDDGMRARVRIPVGDPEPALLINERAIGTHRCFAASPTTILPS